MEEDFDCKCWELFLHSNTEKNYKDFKETILNPDSPQEHKMSKSEIEAAVNQSKKILDGFAPPQ